MARTRTFNAPLPGPTFAPDDPVFRALHLVKGEGRRRLLLALELLGELLPDLLPGEVEAARVIWSLPLDRRTASLRARPHLGGASWRPAPARRSLHPA